MSSMLSVYVVVPLGVIFFVLIRNCVILQYRPMLMNVAQGDVDARLNRYAAFDDNMDVVLQLVYDIHGRIMDINDFEMVIFYSHCFVGF